MSAHLSQFRASVAVAVVLLGAFFCPGVSAKQETPATIVPQLVGQGGQKAKGVVEAAGLVAKFKLGKAAPSREQQFEVYRQVPSASDFVPEGSVVELTIYAQFDPTAATPGAETAVSTPTPPEAQERFAVVVDHAIIPGGAIRALDLSHGEGQQNVSVHRTWLGASFEGSFGAGWADENSISLVQQGDNAVGILVGGVTLVRAYRKDDEYQTDRGATIQQTADGYVLESKGHVLQFDPQGRLIQATRKNGHAVKYVYDSDGRLSRIDNGVDNAIEYVYSETGTIKTILGPEGLAANYEYDQYDRLTAVTNAWQNRIEYEYGVDGEQIFARDAYRNVTRVLNRGIADLDLSSISPDDTTGPFDEPSPVENSEDFAAESVRPALSPLPHEEFDADGRVVKRTERGRVTQWNYDDQGRVIQEHAPEGITTWTYGQFGRAATVTDSTGMTMTYQYNSFGLPIKVESSAGKWETYEYNKHGQVIAHETSGGYREERDYDSVGRLIQLRYTPNRSESYMYNHLDQLVQVTYSSGASVRYGYDASNRRVSEIWSTGQSTIKEYDEAGRLIHVSRNGLEVSRSYDMQGRLSSITDPIRGSKTFDYTNEADNELGLTWGEYGHWSRRTNVWLQPLTTAFDDGRTRRETRFSYAETGDLISVQTPGGRYWRYNYDNAGRLLGVHSPGGPQVETARDQQGRITRISRGGVTFREYLHGPDGRLRMESSPLGIAASYAFDQSGRIQQVVEPDGPVNFQRDEHGLLTDIVGPDYRITQEHHADGLLARRYYETAGLDVKLPIDEFARPAGISLNGMQVVYTYGEKGRVVKVQLPGGHFVSIDHDVAGRPVRYDYTSGLEVTKTYDHANRVTAMRAQDRAGKPVFAETYEFNSLGNLVHMEPDHQPELRMSYDEDDRLRGMFSEQSILSFDYDDDDNLRSVRSNAGESNWQLDEAGRPASLGLRSVYEWDRAGNLTGLNDVNARIENRFDAAGRLTARRVDEYEWRFGYLPDGDRLWREGPDGRTWFAYLKGGLIALKDEADVAWLVVNDPITGSPLALCGSNGAVYFVLADRLGSIRRIVDPDGQVIASSDYGAWGTVEGNDGSAPLAMYAGMVRDNHGLYYARRRYYDPALFRFISLDPSIGVTGSPATHNAYAYAANNPLRFRDPTGASYQPMQGMYDHYGLDDFTDGELVQHHQDLSEQRGLANRRTRLENRLVSPENQGSGRVGLGNSQDRTIQRIEGEILHAENELKRRNLIEQTNEPDLGTTVQDVQAIQERSREDTLDLSPKTGETTGGGTTGGSTLGSAPTNDNQTSGTGAGSSNSSSNSLSSGSSDGSARPSGQNSTEWIPTDELQGHTSANSPEARNRQNRLRRYRLDRNGNVVPLQNVDGVDARPQAGEVNFDVDNDGNLIPGSIEYPDETAADRNLNQDQRRRIRQQVQNRVDQAVDGIGPRAAANAADNVVDAGRSTRPFTSRRPWRGPSGNSPVPGGSLWRRPLSGRQIAGGVLLGGGIGGVIGGIIGIALDVQDVIDITEILYGDALDRGVRRQTTEQDIWARRKREEIIKRLVQRAKDARDNPNDSEFDFLPPLDGRQLSDDEIEQRVRQNVANGLPPFAGILTPRGQAGERDENRFRQDMDLANRLLTDIQNKRRDLQGLNNAINQNGLEIEQAILDAEQSSGIDPADFETLKRETAELNRLCDAYEEDSGQSLADEFEAAANRICQLESSINKDTSPKVIQQRLDDANQTVADLDLKVGPTPNADTRLAEIRALANSVRSRAYELGQFIEQGDQGPNGDQDSRLESIEKNLEQLTQQFEERDRAEESLLEVSKQFRDLLIPWMGEVEARNLWNDFQQSDSDGSEQQAADGDSQLPSMSPDDMQRRLAALKRAMEEMPDDAAEIIAEAEKAVARADALESAPKPGNYLEDKLRIDQARTRLVQCRFDIQQKRDNRSSRENSRVIAADKFRALNPTRRLEAHPSEKPLVAIAREIFEQLDPPKGMVQVPDVVGLGGSAALTRITEAGLIPRFHLGKPVVAGQKPTHVYEQSPKPGTWMAKGGTVSVTVFANAQTTAASQPSKPEEKKPEEPAPKKVDTRLNGVYTWQSTFAGLSSKFEWKQVDDNTASVTLHLNGNESTIFRRYGLPATVTVTAKKSGNRYAVPAENPLSSAFNSASAKLSRSLGGTPAKVTHALTFTPAGNGITVQTRGSNGINTSGTAVK